MSRGKRRKARETTKREAKLRRESCDGHGAPHQWVSECPRCDFEICLSCWAERKGSKDCGRKVRS